MLMGSGVFIFDKQSRFYDVITQIQFGYVHA